MKVQNQSLQSFHRYQPPFLQKFEAEFDGIESTIWFQENFHVAVYATALYCITIFLLHRFMKSQKRFELRRPVIAWNFSLALFHIAVLTRVLPDVIHDIRHFGYEFTLCDTSWLSECAATGRWSRIFVFSKIIEYGDTVFLVLRKRPLTVLHMYHHITVVLSLFFLAAKPTGPGRWAPLVNGSIHVFMYSYFTIKMLGYYVPKWISMILTSAQILQMLYGVYMFTKINLIVAEGRRCDMVLADSKLAIFLAVSYAALFINYFYQNYIKKQDKNLEQKKVK